MPAAVLYMSGSLDGFMTGPNELTQKGLCDGGERLHEWAMTEGGDVALDAIPPFRRRQRPGRRRVHVHQRGRSRQAHA
jgi:hypothetical protein